ncbi:MAG: carbamoyltransferase HypF, partial [Planctomycetota bacterium]|nr:carbamoyltransferase HypF [Planctomycetota bacterium]
MQGIGLRPAIARLALDCQVGGHVANSGLGVDLAVHGPVDALERFELRLQEYLDRAGVEQSGSEQRGKHQGGRLGERRGPPMTLQNLPSEIVGHSEDLTDLKFEILDSTPGDWISVEVPRDVVVCRGCLADVAEAGRREGYPFTTCATCGPRYSVLRDLPFDRERTTLQLFPPCADCDAEYRDPTDRRFHAQTITCPQCGPSLWCTDADGRPTGEPRLAIRHVVQALNAGQIVALRGIGGYQLLCDATRVDVVRRLRDRKGRRAKSLAVMVVDLPTAERVAWLDENSRVALRSAANPIVVVTARSRNGLAEGIHPGLGEVGLMLPSSPLHWLICRAANFPLVVTSGNREGEPLAVEVEEAQVELRQIVDLFLHHNRPISHPVDDSVVRLIAGRMVTLRLARGLAPLGLSLESAPVAIALGGHQKNAIAVSNGRQVALGPHVGDLDGLRQRERFVRGIAATRELYRVDQPAWIVDQHPDYFSTVWGESQPGSVVAVQHHHAHVVAGMLEQGWLDREVLGIAFDGTGYGPDGTIWGGEFLRVTSSSSQRVAHLRPFQLPGGELAIREPWRVALAHLVQSLTAPELKVWCSRLLPSNWKQLRPLVENAARSAGQGGIAPWTSSAGRLFDGVAALVLGLRQADFDGAPAMLLEAACDWENVEDYRFLIEEGEPLQIDWRPMIRELVADIAKGVSPAV